MREKHSHGKRIAGDEIEHIRGHGRFRMTERPGQCKGYRCKGGEPLLEKIQISAQSVSVISDAYHKPVDIKA